MQATHEARRHHTRVARSDTNFVLTGVAGGLGERLGVDPTLVRAAFGVLSLAGGFGVLAYLILWLVSAPPDDAPPRPQLSTARQVGAVACITLGLLIALREVGLWLGDGIVWPVALASLGVSVIWTRGDGARTARAGRPPADAPVFSGPMLVRIGIGAVLVLTGMATILAANATFTWRSLFEVFLPVVVAIAGLTLIFGPWLLRLGQQVAEERRERIRSEERSEMAAHLHDSVLQTLALIQRAGAAREMASLARVQERELRAWLYGKSKTLAHETLESAIDATAGRVEQLHHASVESVVVGDAPLDEKLSALVHAATEAMINAAKHSGSDSISVYVEVQDGEAHAYVRDHGKGFDPSGVPADRRGIAESIVGRMKRYGGTALINSTHGEGTEVHLRMPR